MYSEREAGGKTIVELRCDRKLCGAGISVSADSHKEAQNRLYERGWRVSRGRQICPEHAQSKSPFTRHTPEQMEISRLKDALALPINWRERAEAAEYALRELMALIEQKVLVRDTSRDGEPGWAMRQIPVVMALKHAQNVIDKIGVEGK